MKYKIYDKIYDWEIVAEITRLNRPAFVLQCKCGHKRQAQLNDLNCLVGNKVCTKLSLGQCCRKCKESKYWNSMEDQTLYKSIYTDYKSQAKKRNKTFELTYEQAFKLFKSNCYYCNTFPSNIKTLHKHKETSYKYQGIDRIDPKEGYTSINTVPCCSKCNYAKRDYTQEEFYSWIESVYNFNKDQRLSRKGVEPSGSKWRLP